MAHKCNTRIYFKIYKYISKYTNIFHNTQIYFKIHKYISQHTNIFQNTQIYFTTHKYISKYTNIFQNTQIYFKTHKYISKHTNIKYISNTQIYFQTHIYLIFEFKKYRNRHRYRRHRLLTYHRLIARVTPNRRIQDGVATGQKHKKLYYELQVFGHF